MQLSFSSIRLPPSLCLTTIFISRIEKMSEQNGEIFTFPSWDLWSQRILIYRVVLFIDGYQYLTRRSICHLRFDRQLSVVVRRGRWWYPLRICQVSSPREMRFLTPVSQVNWWNAPQSITGLSFCMKIFPRYIETITSYSFLLNTWGFQLYWLLEAITSL